MCYYDDFYEPSEFDQEVEVFKATLRESVKKEIQEELKELREANDELQLLKMDFEARVQNYKEECQRKQFEAERAVENAKRMRLKELVDAVEPVAWAVDYFEVKQPKCDKCDEWRYRHFKSPLGKEMKEECTCAPRKKVYVVKAAPVVEIYQNHKGDIKTVYLCGEGNDRFSDYSENICDEIPFEEIKYWKVLFRDKNRAMRYMAWKNKREEEKWKNDSCN